MQLLTVNVCMCVSTVNVFIVHNNILRDVDSRLVWMSPGTSGDTGSAAIEAVRGLKWVDIVVILPRNRCTQIQELQMTTVKEDNVFVYRGTAHNTITRDRNCSWIVTERNALDYTNVESDIQNILCFVGWGEGVIYPWIH